MLLTHDQETTMWHLTDTIVTPNGDRYYNFPYFLKPLGGGQYERYTFDQLPEEVKDIILSQQGIKRTA